MTLAFTQGSGDAWSFAFYEGNTLAGTFTSASTGDSLWNNTISQADLYSLNGGSSRTLGNNGNLYFNILQVTSPASTPEPSTVLLGGLSGLAMLSLLRRRG